MLASRQATHLDVEVFRNPLVHVGGMTSKPWFKGRTDDFFRTPKINHTFPGLATPHENEAVIADYCKETLCGDVLLRMEAFQSIVYSGTTILVHAQDDRELRC